MARARLVEDAGASWFDYPRLDSDDVLCSQRARSLIEVASTGRYAAGALISWPRLRRCTILALTPEALKSAFTYTILLLGMGGYEYTLTGPPTSPKFVLNGRVLRIRLMTMDTVGLVGGNDVVICQLPSCDLLNLVDGGSAIISESLPPKTPQLFECLKSGDGYGVWRRKRNGSRKLRWGAPQIKLIPARHGSGSK
jgi:hypothetical protein